MGGCSRSATQWNLYNQPATRFVAWFIGSPALNFAQVRIAAENGSLWAKSEDLRIKVLRSTRAAMARAGTPGWKRRSAFGPEDLRIAGAGG